MTKRAALRSITRIGTLAVFLCVLLGNPQTGILRAATRAVPMALPLTCLGSPTPAACVYGYVYWDSTPVSGASVKIDSSYGTLNTTTATGALSSVPYFQAAVSTAPLLISPGGTITITATYNGSTANTTYVVAAGGQQADVYIPASAMFGNGMDGDLSVSSTVDLNPVRASASGSAGSALLSISGVTGSGFQANQLVLIHQSRGTGAGNWELRTIQTVAVGQLTLTAPLSNTYLTDTGANRAQVIWVPQYRNLTVQLGGTVSPTAWNGSTGGILAFLSSGTTTIAGTINLNGNNGDSSHTGASGIGYRGGDGHGSNNGTASQGDGTNGMGTISTGANGNGGGGANAIAVGSGGGGGGNGGLGSNGVGNGLGTGGSGGSTAGSADLTIMTFGGGGGGGSQASNPVEGNGGGAGGGIALMLANTFTVTGSITANGGNGGSLGAGHDADGGGGAGGSVLIRGQRITLGISLLTATGGYRTGNQGGNGSVGRIRVEYVSSFSGSTNPVASVQQTIFSSIPIPTNNTIYPTTASQPQGDVVSFRGQAGIADLSGATITTYVWRSDRDGLLSTQASFTRTASSLSAGTHNIFLKVKDSNNNWSDEVSRQLVIVPFWLYLPVIRR